MSVEKRCVNVFELNYIICIYYIKCEKLVSSDTLEYVVVVVLILCTRVKAEKMLQLKPDLMKQAVLTLSTLLHQYQISNHRPEHPSDYSNYYTTCLT